ncbi:kinase domain protein [Xylaria venustula]|nr:kinase domain protein [Xylaria venustula]
MSLFSRMLRLFCCRAPLQPRVFPSTGFIQIPQDEKFEEERLKDYDATRYYPVRIGEVFANRYQVVGKLGFGYFSTVWLARDLQKHRHVTLKVLICSHTLGDSVNTELAMYERVQQRRSRHPGRNNVRSLLDSFTVTGPEGEHLCLVHRPLGRSVADILHQHRSPGFQTNFLRSLLKDLLLAVDYLHTECQIIHTDISTTNILYNVYDHSVFSDFEEEEIRNPCRRKEVDGRVIYASRGFRYSSKVGNAVLCDFGVSVFGDEEHYGVVQPTFYRSPEVTLDASWDYKIDLWNIGCVIWSLYERRDLFRGLDPEHQEYRSRAQLAEIIAVLGPPPKNLLARGRLTSEFFSSEGQFIAGIDIPASTSLEAMEINLEGNEKKRFLKFMGKMLQWDPAQRGTARELFKDPWLQEWEDKDEDK